MAVLIKAKRVSDPLNDRVKARLLVSSSGTEHCGDPSSCLCGLVHGFFVLDEPDQSINCCRESIRSSDNDEERDDLSSHVAEMVGDLLRSCSSRPDLDSAVMEVMTETSRLSGNGRRLAVMAKLRERGYNAGLCKARWSSSGALTAGSYEYIDVVFDDDVKERYIVDLDFAAQFEIARATSEYEKLVASLPVVVAARAEEVKQAVRAMARSAKRSLKRRELSVPPWRKRRYMMAKWFGPYRRTVSPLPAVAGGKEEMVARCRAVGFGPAGPVQMVSPAITRT